MSQKLQTPSVLAFESKLICSDAQLFSGNWEDKNADNWSPIKVMEKSVRGTISNRIKDSKIKNDNEKMDKEVQKANLQTVDTASLPLQHDTLKVSFTVRVIGDLHKPSTCNSPDYEKALADVIKNYVTEQSFDELAVRYAWNIANGRFLWRNRVGAEMIDIQVKLADGSTYNFDAYDYPVNDIDTDELRKEEPIQKLAQSIHNGLTGETYSLITVNAFVKLGAGQQVFPSQELILDKDDTKSKHLYQLTDQQAAMHSQKVGNALRTIDSWHKSVDEVGVIAIEPYGSVTNRGKAYRTPKDKLDFYTILDKWLVKGDEPSVENQHYVMAMLIRGGVFGE